MASTSAARIADLVEVAATRLPRLRRPSSRGSHHAISHRDLAVWLWAGRPADAVSLLPDRVALRMGSNAPVVVALLGGVAWISSSLPLNPALPITDNARPSQAARSPGGAD